MNKNKVTCYKKKTVSKPVKVRFTTKQGEVVSFTAKKKKVTFYKKKR